MQPDVLDVLDEEGFTPCRDDRCDIEELHREHPIGRFQHRLVCPWCKADLLKLKRLRARCSSCSWQGSLKTAQRNHAGHSTR